VALEPDGHEGPSLAERYLEARNCGDLAAARWLGRQLERRLSAGPPKEEDPNEFDPRPSRLPGSSPRRQRSQMRSVGKR
jgi:hypothetical protein